MMGEQTRKTAIIRNFTKSITCGVSTKASSVSLPNSLIVALNF